LNSETIARRLLAKNERIRELQLRVKELKRENRRLKRELEDWKKWNR